MIGSMKKYTEYGFIAEAKDGPAIFKNLNLFLGKYKRKFVKSKGAAQLSGHLPQKYAFVYFNLNKDMVTYMEVFENQDTRGKYAYPKHKNVNWILEVLINDDSFPGYEKAKTEKYIKDLIAAAGFKTKILRESNNA